MEIYRCKRCTEIMFEGELRGVMEVKCPVCKATNIVGIFQSNSDFDIVASIRNDMIEGIDTNG